VAAVHSEYVTIKQLLTYMAHVEGGVHCGRVKVGQEHIAELVDSILVNGEPMATRTLEAIATLVLRGLTPLMSSVARDLGVELQDASDIDPENMRRVHNYFRQRAGRAPRPSL
jgi:hypothetical protein